MYRFLISLTLFALLSTVATHAQNEVQEVRITTARANVHTCAQLDCSVMATYATGTPLFILGEETGDAVQNNAAWYRIRDSLTGQEGYISAVLTDAGIFEDWQLRPVVPTSISQRMKEVYAQGLAMGNDPTAFSKVGDCQNVTPYFLAPFDQPADYSLGTFSPLQSTIDHFEGSFGRVSGAVDNGYNVASVLSPRWASRVICERGETPLECEERLYNPSIVIVNMETWWQDRPATEYEDYLNQIVEFWLAQGVVPIVGTKADNLEGDHGINAAVVRVADRYELPLWNFWLAVQQLPGHGLSEDGFHLTFARDFYDDPERLLYSWPVRNLTALGAIDAVWRELNPAT
jgi:hypothetical protein